MNTIPHVNDDRSNESLPYTNTFSRSIDAAYRSGVMRSSDGIIHGPRSATIRRCVDDLY